MHVWHATTILHTCYSVNQLVHVIKSGDSTIKSSEYTKWPYEESRRPNCQLSTTYCSPPDYLMFQFTICISFRPLSRWAKISYGCIRAKNILRKKLLITFVCNEKRNIFILTQKYSYIKLINYYETIVHIYNIHYLNSYQASVVL
jgi:hypothetical protein